MYEVKKDKSQGRKEAERDRKEVNTDGRKLVMVERKEQRTEGSIYVKDNVRR